MLRAIKSISKHLVYGLLLFSLFLGSTQLAFGQNITLNVKNQPIKNVLQEIQRQSDYRFVYNDNLVNVKQNVTINVDKSDILATLNKLFDKLPISYQIVNNQIILSPKSATQTADVVLSRRGRITGTVKDQQGEPLPGVFIHNYKTNRTVYTGIDGTFEISEIAAGDSLNLSMIGLQNKVLICDGSDCYDIILLEDFLKLDDVVVTGYYTLSKERTAGSFSTVRNEALETKSASLNVVDRLEGLVPGLSVNMSEGADKFLMRGLTSINAERAPLVVIDGIPSSYGTVDDLVNPNDVESITFLKDATAASIWGASAANGVINIVTKSGARGVRTPKVTYNAFVSFRGKPDHSYQNYMDSEMYVRNMAEIFDPVNTLWGNITNPSSIRPNPVVYPHEQLLYDHDNGLISKEEMESGLAALGTLNNRAQIEQHLLRNQVVQNHNLIFSGGSRFHSYYFSYGYTGDYHYNKSDNSKHQVNLRQQFNFTDHIRLDLTANLSYDNGQQYMLPHLPFGLDNYIPYAMFADGSGNALSHALYQRYEPFRTGLEQASRLDLDYFPLLENDYTKNKNTNLNARVQAGLDIDLFPWLQYQGKFGYQKGVSRGYQFYDQDSYQVRDELVYFTQAGATPDAPPTYFLPMNGGHYYTNTGEQTSWTIRNQLAFDQTVSGKHEITAIAGTEIRADLFQTQNTNLRGYDFQSQTYRPYDEKFLSSDGVSNPVLSQGSFPTNTLRSSSQRFGEIETRFFSLYANAAYTYDRKYLFNASIRMDQSNLYGTNKSTQYRPIWSVGAGWNLHNEDFMEGSAFDNLVARLTFGYGGNSPRPGSGGPFDVLYPTNNPMFDGLGYEVALPANKDLSWERTATTNLGIDFSVLKHRVSGSLDLYMKRTEDLLGKFPVDPTTGFYFAYGNLGNISNDGFEFMLNTLNVAKNNFSWNSVFTLSYNKNKLTSLKRDTPLTYSSKIYEAYIEGYPAFSLFGYDYKGLNENGDPVAYNAAGEEVMLSNELTEDDPIFAGSALPKWFGGFTNEFRFKNFTLSALIVYNLGHKMRKDVNSFYSERAEGNINKNFDNRWRVAGDENHTDIPRYMTVSAESAAIRYTPFYTHAVQNIMSASYIKMRDITLSYNLPRTFSRKLLMEDLVIYGQVNNLLLWANNSQGIDPEYYNLRGAYGMGGIRTNRMPPQVTFGIRVNFL